MLSKQDNPLYLLNEYQFRLFIPREEKAMISPHLLFKIYLCINPRSLSLTKEIYTYKGSGPCAAYIKYAGVISLLITPNPCI